MSVDLAFRTQAACDQLTRYGGGLFNEELCALIEKISDINDDLAHGRDTSFIKSGVYDAKTLLDAVYARHLKDEEDRKR